MTRSNDGNANGAIAIVGGGLGGLMLARVLHTRGVDAHVYEVDASPTARHQGGMLDMHEDSGQLALRAAGLFEQFERHVLPGGDAMRVLDKHGTVFVDEKGGGGRPEIDRTALRRLLIESLPPAMISWGKRVTSASRLASGAFAIAFADGTSIETRALVGADGAFSKVRALLTDVVPEYAGISFAEARVLHASTDYPALAAVVGDGMLFALSDDKGFLAHRESDDELCIYAALKTSADWSKATVTRAAVLEHYADWSDSLRALIRDGTGELIARPIYALPVGHRWTRMPGVTLIGDAAHLMSPFAGEGANLALQDGAELALAIIEHADIDSAFAAYEDKMFPRSEQAAIGSAEGLKMCIASDAPRALVEFFSSHPSSS